MVSSELLEIVATTTGAAVERAESVSGGDICDAYRITFTDGERCFLKTLATASSDFFEAEADGLRWLAEAGAIATPAVMAVGTGPQKFLLLEWIEPVRPTRSMQESLGHALATLHRSAAPYFGHHRDNFIGRLGQSNTRYDRWADFYRAERLECQLRVAAEQRTLPRETLNRASRLLDHLEGCLGPEEPPARLHGDLWGGNAIFEASRGPVLIDPAVYGGHREIDLAMMQLFGGFSEHVFGAYHECYPLAEGHRERLALYQLYPLLVHVNLFGGGYASSVSRALSSLGF